MSMLSDEKTLTEYKNAGRSAARLAVIQALYQMELSGRGVEAVIEEFEAHRLGGELEGEALHDADRAFFADLARGVVAAQRDVDQLIEANLAEKWTLSRIDSTARAILRSGVYELLERKDVPYKAVIDEYVDVAKAFFEDGAEPGFINGALDAIAREARGDL
ncbi:MAG: transcription antitermination factor NusB [Pseudomonadota bacterium]